MTSLENSSSKIQSFLLNRKLHFLTIFILGTLLGYFFNESQRKNFDLPQWAIMEGIDVTETPEEANDFFNKHVQQEFYNGLEEKILIRELRAAGFRLDWRTTANTKLAFHYEWELRCKKVRSVSWQVDNKGLLITATGSYSRNCKKN